MCVGRVFSLACGRGGGLCGGGHAMAGGFTFNVAKLEDIKQFMRDNIKDRLSTYLEQNDKYADLLLNCDAVNEKLVAELENLGPFGTDNPKPVIILKDAVVLNTKKFGRNKEHLRCIVGTNNVSTAVNTLIVNIFRVSENDVLLNTLGKVGTKCDLIGTLSINKWMNLNNIQFIVDDVIL